MKEGKEGVLSPDPEPLGGEVKNVLSSIDGTASPSLEDEEAELEELFSMMETPSVEGESEAELSAPDYPASIRDEISSGIQHGTVDLVMEETWQNETATLLKKLELAMLQKEDAEAETRKQSREVKR